MEGWLEEKFASIKIYWAKCFFFFFFDKKHGKAISVTQSRVGYLEPCNIPDKN